MLMCFAFCFIPFAAHVLIAKHDVQEEMMSIFDGNAQPTRKIIRP